MIGRLARMPFVRAGAPVFAATLLWQLSNFVFNAAGARLLGPATYGSLAAAVGLLYLVNPLLITIQTVASRETTAYISSGRLAELRGAMWFYGWRLGGASVVAFIALAAASPWISGFLKIDTTGPIVVLAAALPLWCIALLQRGVFQGSQRFGRLAISTAVEAVAKIASAIALLTLFWRGATGGMLAVVVGASSALLVGALMLRYLPYSEVRHVPRVHPARYTVITLATLVLLAVLLSTDTLAAKHYMSPETAGLYAGVSICGKIVYFITSVLSIYLFPLFSAHHDRGQDARRRLGVALAIILGGALVIVGVFSVAPQLVVTPLLGDKFGAADQFVGLAGFAFGLYGCVYLCAMYLLAQRQAAVIAVLGVAAGGLVVGLYASHNSIPQLLHVLIVTFGLTAGTLTTWAMLRKPARAQSIELDGARAAGAMAAGATR
jgi:O-antigen/teichoic acid export membrane protein